MSKFVVYLIKQNGVIMSVGKTDNFTKRKWKHLNKRGTSSSAIPVDVDLSTVEITPIEYYETKVEALKRETELMIKYHTIENGWNQMKSWLSDEDKKEYQEKWHLEHEEENKEYCKQWYDENKDYKIEYQKQYYDENKENILGRNKQYYDENKEKILERKKQYYLEHKDEINAKRRKKKQQKKNGSELINYHFSDYDIEINILPLTLLLVPCFVYRLYHSQEHIP